MKENEKIFLKTLFEHGKRISKPPHYINLLYMLTEICAEAGVGQESILEILESPYIEWIRPEGVRLTDEGIVYCQDYLDRPPLGFLP